MRRRQCRHAEGRGFPFVIDVRGTGVGAIDSIRAAEKAGYRDAGLLPAHHEIGGAARDMLLYSRIA